MVLSADAIRLRMMRGDIEVVPLIDASAQLSGASLMLHLGNDFAIVAGPHTDVLDSEALDAANQAVQTLRLGADESITVHPGELLRASTLENVRLPGDLISRVYGLQSLSGLGLQVASLGELGIPSFHGQVPLQITNVNRIGITLHVRMPICSMMFEEVRSNTTVEQN